MAEISSRWAKIFLLVEEIMGQSFIVVSSLVNHILREERSHRRQDGRVIRYVMVKKIERQLEHLESLISARDIDCLEQLRMPCSAFARLCFLLRNVGGLKDSRHISLNEKVALFLSILSHHQKIRVVKFDFKQSGHTVSKHFHSVLVALLRLHPILPASPEPVDDTCDIPRWKWFQGCLGALDGTYICVTVPEAHKPRYRTRKGDVAVNMLGVCDLWMRFVYVLTGWEGSAEDCRVLRDAVTRDNGFRIPQGQYYLCDNGYTNADGFPTPYKGVRYHLDEWGEGSRTPQNPREYFNMSHAKARNVIKRTFGLLKKWWAIIRSPSFYLLKTQNRIIMACSLLHNYLRNEMPTDPLENELEGVDILHEDSNPLGFIETVEPSQSWTTFREDLAQSMWEEWRALRGINVLAIYNGLEMLERTR